MYKPPTAVFHSFRKSVTCNGIKYIGMNVVTDSQGKRYYLVDYDGREICSVRNRRKYKYAV